MAKVKHRRSQNKNRPRRHPPFGATKKTGEKNARARDRANIDFLTVKVDRLEADVRQLEAATSVIIQRLDAKGPL